MKKIKIGTLFSGIGSPEQALPRVYDEHEIVFACEWDKFARQSYLANYDIDENHFHKDINDMDGKQYAGNVDMIIGGSPCQDFSIAGLRAGIEGQRGQLIWQYFRIINEVQQEVFIYENVKGMVSDKGGKTLKEFLEVFRSIGYHCHAEVLNTKDYGVPQNRERIYIVGFKNHNHYHRFEYAPKVPLEKRLKDVLESEVDEKYYIDHKKFNYDGGDQLNPEYSSQANSVYDCEGHAPTLCAFTHGYAQGYFKEHSIIQRPRGYNEGGEHFISPTLSSNSCHENNILKEPKIVASRGRNPQNHSDRTPGNRVEQRLEVNENGTSNALTTVQKDNYVLEPKIKEENLSTDRVNKTLRCGGGSSMSDKHNFDLLMDECSRIRKLTPRECLRLQDFSDSFVQVVSDSQQYKQAGNSMSVNVLEMLFRQIEKAQSDEPTNTLLDFIKEA